MTDIELENIEQFFKIKELNSQLTREKQNIKEYQNYCKTLRKVIAKLELLVMEYQYYSMIDYYEYEIDYWKYRIECKRELETFKRHKRSFIWRAN